MTRDNQRHGVLARVLSAACTVLALAVAAAATGAPAGASSSSWVGQAITTAPALGDTITLNAVSCPSAGNCFAVGSYDNSGGSPQPLIETLSGGTWTATVPPDPSGSRYVTLTGISCTSTTACVAIGNDAPTSNPDGADQYGFAEVLSGATWTVSSPFAYPSGVIVVSMDAITCLSATSCVAVGNSDFGSGDEAGIAYTLTGTTWSGVGGFGPTSNFLALSSISCTSITACLAVGFVSDSPSYIPRLLVETLSSGSWSATEPSNPSLGSGGAELSAVSCTTSTACVAVGSYTDSDSVQHGLAESLSGTTWTSTTANLDPDDNGSALSGVTCTDATDCVAVGNYYDVGFNQHALVETLSGSAWTATSGLDPADSNTVELSAVSCADSSHCVAVGSWQDANGDQFPFDATNSSGPSTTQFGVSAAASATAGTATSVTLTAEASSGSTTTGYTGSQTIVFTGPSNSPNATEPSYPVTVSFTAGVGTASVTLPDAQSTTLTATQGSITGTSNTIAVAPATASQFGVSAPANATAGSSFSVTTTAEDPYGNVATSYAGSKTVVFSGPSNSPNGTAPSYPATVSFLLGVDTASVTLPDAQLIALTATQGSITGASSTIVVAASAAFALKVTGFPSPTTAGVFQAFTVTAIDTFGNVAKSYAGVVHFSSSDGAASLPANHGLTLGVKAFSAALSTAGSQTITATDTVTGSIDGTSNTITVNPAPASHFVVSAPGTATAGNATGVTVTAEDPFGNVDTSYAGSKTVAFTGPSSSPNATAPTYPATVGFSAGVGNASVSLFDAQSTTLTATQGSVSGTSSSIVVTAAAASQLAVTAPPSATAGDAMTVSVSGEDPYGNVDMTYAGTRTVAFAGPSSSPDATAPIYPANVSFSAGVGTASVTLFDAQSTTLTATQGPIAGVSNVIAVAAGTASSFAVTGFPSQTIAGASHAFTVTALDSFGNTATSYAGTVAFTSSDPQAVLPANSTLTAGAGVFSAELRTPSTQTITATDTVNGSITGSSGTITAAPGAVTQFVVTTPADVTAGDAFDVTLTAEDSYGNVDPTYAGTDTVVFTGPSSSPDSTAPAYPVTVTFSAGTGTASVTLPDAQSTPLSATQGSITGTSNSIVVNPAAAIEFGLATPPTATAGNVIGVTLTAEDPFGNVGTSYAGTKVVVFAGPSSSPNGTAPGYPATVSFSAGVGTASVALADAQSTTLSATQGSLSGVSSTITVSPAAASQFVVGTTPSATVGSLIGVTITAEDPYGNVETSYAGIQTVVFSGPSSSPDATAPTYPASVNFSAGVGTTSVTLTDAQSTTLSATQGSLSGVSNTITVDPGTTSALTVTGFPSPTTAGVAHTFTVTAVDPFGNTAPSYSGTVGLRSSDPQAVLPADSTLTDGIEVLSAQLRTPGPETITATDTGTSSINGTSSTITVDPAAAILFIVDAPAGATAGSSISVTMNAEDPFGSVDTSYAGSKTVVFTGPASSPDATAPSYPATVSFSAGVGTASVTLPDAQSTTLTVAQGSIDGTSNTITVAAAAAGELVVGLPASATAGNLIDVSLTAEDPFGNVDAAYAGSKTVVFTGPSDAPDATSPGYPTSVNFSAGVGTAPVTLPDARSTTLTATVGPVSGSSATISVNPAAASQFVLATPASATAGSSIGVTVTAEDPYGNLETSYSGSKTVVFTGPSSSPDATGPGYPATVNFSAGVGTAPVTLPDAQSTTISAAQGPVSGISSTITVVPGTTSGLTVTGFPSPTTAGVSHTFTVTAVDSFGNSTSSYAGTVRFSSSDDSASLPDEHTLTNGVGLFSAVLRTEGGQTITAADTVIDSVTGTSNTIAVGAAAANRFVLTTPTNATAGNPIGVTVTAEDPFGNHDTSYTGIRAVVFTGPSSSPDGTAPTYPATVSFTAGVGIASVTLPDAQSTTLAATQGSINGTSNTIAVGAASASRFLVSAPAAVTTGNPASVTITAEDPFGNVDTSYAGSNMVVFTGPSSSPNATAPTYPAAVGFSGGIGTTSVTLTDAQSTTLTATQGPVSGTSGTITVGPAEASRFAVRAPARATAGNSVRVTVTADDRYGNIASSYTGSEPVVFTGPSRSPNATFPAYRLTTRFSAGVGATSVTFADAQSTTLTATQVSITGTSSAIKVGPAAASRLIVSTSRRAVAGRSAAVTVTVEDRYQNLDTSYRGMVRFSSSDPRAALPADGHLSNGTRVFRFELETPGSQTITATDTAHRALTRTSGAIVVTAVPSAPTRLRASGGSLDVSLRWSLPSGDGGSRIKTFAIFRGRRAAGEGSRPIAMRDSLSYVDTEISRGVTYFYVIKAVNALGRSTRSNEVNATVTSSLAGGRDFAGIPDGGGYWVISRGGSVTAFGAAHLYGSLAGRKLGQPVVGITSTIDGKGYWLVTANGGVFPFGDARRYGSLTARPLKQPVVGIASTGVGNGYWLVTANGGVFPFGDAHFHGSLAGRKLNWKVVGITITPDAKGYWLVTANGGVFPFGDAHFYGAIAGKALNEPVIGIVDTPNAKGYWLVASDGGVFSFGDAHFYGSLAGKNLAYRITGLLADPTGAGYSIVNTRGRATHFGR
jgi:hypothetical protein